MKISTLADLANLIKHRRKSLKLSQTDIAKKIGVTRQWVATVEHAKETVEIGLVIKLLNALDMPLISSENREAQMKSFSKFFAEGIAKKIAQKQMSLKAGEGEERQAAILFIDLKGFTEHTKTSSPNTILAMLSEYQALVIDTVKAHDGDVDKFLGDGIMISFGAVTPNNSYAAEALRCAEEIAQKLRKWQHQRQVQKLIAPESGIGIAVGKVIFGAVGSHDRMEFTLIGETVNLASKLEKHTRKEKAAIITTRMTLDLAYQQGYVSRQDPRFLAQVSLRGLVEPLDLVIV